MPVFVIALLTVALFLAAVMLLRVGVELSYHEGRLRVRAGAAGLYAVVYPRAAKKPKKRREKAGKKAEKKAKRDVRETLSLVRAALRGARRVWRRLLKGIHIVTMDICVVAASQSAADAALLYGRLCAAVGAAYPLVEELFTVRGAHIRVDADFTREKPKLDAELRATASVGRLLSAAALFLLVFLKQSWKTYDQGESFRLKTAGDTVPRRKKAG